MKKRHEFNDENQSDDTQHFLDWCRMSSLMVVPAQSLGADVLIVQAGEDAVDDVTLLLSPFNHVCSLGFCLFSSRLKEKMLSRFFGAPSGSI